VFAVGIDSAAHHLTVYENERQAVVAFLLKGASNGFIPRELLRLLCEIEAFHADTVVRKPVKISCEMYELRIDCRAADAGGTAHGRVKYLNSLHG
jgi:hypothetical protein